MNTIRVWPDELARLPEYSTTVPTGVRYGKAWKAKARGGDWWVRMYWEVAGVCYTVSFRVVLLEGPREPGAPSRFPSADQWHQLPRVGTDDGWGFPAHGGGA